MSQHSSSKVTSLGRRRWGRSRDGYRVEILIFHWFRCHSLFVGNTTASIASATTTRIWTFMLMVREIIIMILLQDASAIRDAPIQITMFLVFIRNWPAMSLNVMKTGPVVGLGKQPAMSGLTASKKWLLTHCSSTITHTNQIGTFESNQWMHRRI